MSRMFLPHFDVICDLLQYRTTATSNLFVLHENDVVNGDIIYESVFQ